MNRQALADTWWEILQQPAEAFFADHPERMTSDAWGHGRIASPGYVGQRYEPGADVLIANFPGGGGAASLERPHPDDERLYGSFKALAAAEGAPARLEAFEAMNRTWIAVQHQHRIFQNLIAHVIDDLGRSENEVAFLNTFPLRCQENQGITVSMRRAAWKLAIDRQLELLAPGRLLCLGAASAEVVERFYTGRAKRFRFPRSRGDQALTREAREELARLQADRL